MTTSNLARRDQPQAIEQQGPRKELSLETVSEMTGFTLPQIALIRNTVGKDATTLVDLALFLTAANDLKLNPLLRQVHWIMRGGKGVLQVGIDGYRSIAERTGVYAGSEPAAFRGQIEQSYNAKEWVRDDEGRSHEEYVDRTMIVPEKASVIVWKIVAGHKAAFTGEAYWTEFYPGQKEGFQWRKMPRHMLAKVAEAQALRKAFPAQLGAVAYDSGVDMADIENLPEVGVPSHVIEQVRTESPRPTRTTEEYERTFGDDAKGTAFADLPRTRPAPPPPEQGARPPAAENPDSAAAPAATEDGQDAIATALAENAALVEDARGLGVKGLGPLTAKQGWPLDKVVENNTELRARIRSHNADLDQHAARPSDQAQAQF